MSDPSRDHIKAILTSTLDGPETDAQRTERLATTLHALFPAPRVVTTVDVLLAHAVQTNSHGFTTGCRCGFKAHSYLRYAQHIAALLTPAPEREPVTAEQAFDVFVRSFNGDEAGDIDDVSSLDGNTGWAMRGGNDVRAVFDKALRAILPVTDEEAGT